MAKTKIKLLLVNYYSTVKEEKKMNKLCYQLIRDFKALISQEPEKT